MSCRLAESTRIVLSSPSDVENEHQIFEEIISELNKGIAESFNILFEITRWKTDAYPGFHKEGPQGLIDPILDIENCDILIGIFWKRFGTPTKQAWSGTEHEFINAYKSWQNKGLPQIMMYFKDTKITLKTSAEVEQYKKLMQFREKFPRDGLYWTFKDIPQFERLVRNHLTQYLKHKKPDEYKIVETNYSLITKKIKEKPLSDIYDVFLAHNSADKSLIEVICDKLRSKGLNPWLDKEQIPPGRWFQDVIQDTIKKISSAAIFISNNGLSRWQIVELHSFISQCVERKIPIIPVLLPGVEKIPNEFVFLNEFNWVKFKNDINEEDALDNLIWGITGRHPKRH